LDRGIPNKIMNLKRSVLACRSPLNNLFLANLVAIYIQSLSAIDSELKH
jgi:hypothetical protein